MHVNDVKHATLLARLVLTEGHINDLEHAWLDLQGAESWEDHAINLGFTSVSAWLLSLGHTGAINDQWYKYWIAG